VPVQAPVARVRAVRVRPVPVQVPVAHVRAVPVRTRA
jgi:hypothetical protein